MKKNTSIVLLSGLLLLAGGLMLLLSDNSYIPQLSDSRTDSDGRQIYGDIDAIVQEGGSRTEIRDVDTTVSIDILGAANINSVLSVTAWVVSPRRMLWEEKIDPRNLLVKRVPPDQDIAILIHKSQFGDEQSRTVRLTTGEDKRLIFDMARPFILDIQLAGLPPEIIADTFVTVSDAAPGNPRWNFQHCRTDATGSVRVAYGEARLLKVKFRHGSRGFALKQRGGGEIFRNDAGYIEVEPLNPVIFAKAVVNGKETSKFVATTERGAILPQRGIVALDATLEQVSLVAAVGWIWTELRWGSLDLSQTSPEGIVLVPCNSEPISMDVAIGNYEKAGAEGVSFGVFGPHPENQPSHYKWRNDEPRGKIIEIDGPVVNVSPLVPGYYTFYWVTETSMSSPIKQVHVSGVQSDSVAYKGSSVLEATLRDAESILDWIGMSKTGIVVNGNILQLEKSGNFALHSLSEGLPSEILFQSRNCDIMGMKLPVTSQVTGSRVQFTVNGMRKVRVEFPTATLADSMVGMSHYHKDLQMRWAVRGKQEDSAWRMLCPEGEDFSFTVTEDPKGQSTRFRGFVYVDGYETIVRPQLLGSMGTVQVGDIATGITLIAQDRTGDRYEMAHLLPNSNIELWLPVLKPGEEFLVEGCTATHDQINNRLVIEREN